jgi:hypothetical protein
MTELAQRRILVRARTRRRRPPTGRQVYGLLWMAGSLANLAHVVVLTLTGELWVVIGVPVAFLWGLLYWFWRQLTRVLHLRDRPVLLIEWVCLGLVALSWAAAWGGGA